MNEKSDGIYEREGELFTKNLNPGIKVYGEKLINEKGIEYRSWDPNTSKLAAAIKKGLKTFPFKKDSEILYLGAASGTTVSHLSDILTEGIIYAVEFSPKVVKNLINLSKTRKNIAPLFIDARKPSEIGHFVNKIDIIYQDVAQRDQTEILLRNSREFLQEGGLAFFALKIRSISSSKSMKEIAQFEEEKLKKEFEIVEKINLEPFEKEHFFYVLKSK